ncbi:MAG: hypothetical protein J5687_05785 [Treponema sp.]|nr:hypothetical protein [Treponema sp.]
MDDKEYYSMMNRSSSWTVQQTLKKKPQKKDPAKKAEQTYTSLELRQGKADAEMLIEKRS